MTNTDKLNIIYSKHHNDCDGSFHNALWQIMINDSCYGAFTYIDSSSIVGIAQHDGGYIPAGFDIPDHTKREAILADLNMQVFGLTEKAVLDIELMSLAS